MARILIDRIRSGIDCLLRKKEQAAGTIEQILILWNISEKVNEWQATVYLNFIDFDSIHSESLWIIMKKYGILGRIVRMTKTYENFQCAVEDQDRTCARFDVRTGVKQGCNISELLFLIVIHRLGNEKNSWPWRERERDQLQVHNET